MAFYREHTRQFPMRWHHNQYIASKPPTAPHCIFSTYSMPASLDFGGLKWSLSPIGFRSSSFSFVRSWGLQSTKFFMRSLFALVSLFWVPVSTRSLVSFVMPKVHFWSLILIFFFSKVVSQGGCRVNWFQEVKWVQWHTMEQGLMALNCLPMQLKLNSCGWWTTGGAQCLTKQE